MLMLLADVRLQSLALPGLSDQTVAMLAQAAADCPPAGTKGVRFACSRLQQVHGTQIQTSTHLLSWAHLLAVSLAFAVGF